MARIGCARVSTFDQDLDGQLAKLHEEGCEVVRFEKVSGASREGRPELATIIAFFRPGDELVGMHLDRLGRDTRDVLKLIHESKGPDDSYKIIATMPPETAAPPLAESKAAGCALVR